eukprot:scaffold256929_cov32-Tisochrysis_lutea.AAC.1
MGETIWACLSWVVLGKAGVHGHRPQFGLEIKEALCSTHMLLPNGDATAALLTPAPHGFSDKSDANYGQDRS